MVPPHRQRRFVLAAVALALGLTLAGAEVLIRVLTPYNTPDSVRAHSLQYEPTIFARHRLAPNQAVRVDEAWGKRASALPTDREFRINADGYRGPAIARPKPPGEIRVLVLGGSGVFDPNATEGRDWPHLVEERLANHGHANVRVINAGVPGHASFDSLGRFYAQAWTFEPDYVLVYHAWNDLKYFTEITPERPLLTLYRPHAPGADPFQHYRGPLDWLLSCSQLYVKARTRYLLWRHQPGIEGAAPARPGPRTYGPLALAQYRLLLELLVDGARNVGATPVLLTEATLVTPSNDATDRARIAYEYQGLSHEALVGAFADTARTVTDVAARKQALFLDAAAALNGRSELFSDQVHFTPTGSEAMADLVATFLAAQLDARHGDAHGK